MPTDPALLDSLLVADLSVEGRLVAASNATLYCLLDPAGAALPVVYKPVAGERPLWDFPADTLGHREVAAWEVSAAVGWDIVPPTVWRDGPFGPGMVQLWVDVDDSVDPVALLRSRDDRLRRVSVFDVVINNGDRKGGHLLPTAEGRVWGIDHGVTFAVEPKLRTLLWQWEGDPVPADLLALARRTGDGLAAGRPLRARVAQHLSDVEIDATCDRVERLLSAGVHPGPSPDWPPVPWPPF